MKSNRLFTAIFAFSLLAGAAASHAAPVSGTVTDKTTGKPAAGDTVELLDVQAAMGAVAHATTNGQGHYTLNGPGAGPYLIRVTHQGAPYFIAAPQGAGPGDVSVFDVSQKVQEVFIEADIMEMETDPGGQLSVSERWLVHNTSTPPTTQWSKRSFEIVLPDGAQVQDTQAQRPSGLPTSLTLDPDGAKGHYSFNFPIQPDDGDKDTLFQVSYTLPYSSGKLDFKPVVTLPAENVAVILPKSMSITSSDFKPVNSDPGVLTFLAKNATPGKALAFTVSGTGSLPREQQGGQGDNGQQAAPGNQPGGGIGAPINTPGPLDQHHFLGLSAVWWILILLAVVLIGSAAFLLRKPSAMAYVASAQGAVPGSQPAASFAATPANRNVALLSVLKDEMFELESERIAGTLSSSEYAEQKAALEIVLKRALKKK
ncbi:MAG: carboxypeptidase regulatory-like domain-containing protein [Terracidiphilus sp.]